MTGFRTVGPWLTDQNPPPVTENDVAWLMGARLTRMLMRLPESSLHHIAATSGGDTPTGYTVAIDRFARRHRIPKANE